MVDAVDRSLVDCAKAVAKLADLKRVARQVQAQFPPQEHVTAGSFEISAAGETERAEKTELIDGLGMELSQLRAIAQRDWTDLVNVNDYLEPQQEWVQTSDNQYHQRADWIVSLNRELLPVGNFVVRCLWKRIKTRMSFMARRMRDAFVRFVEAIVHIRVGGVAVKAEKILVATDLSAASQLAFEAASRLAHQTGAKLLVLHVEPGQPRLSPAYLCCRNDARRVTSHPGRPNSWSSGRNGVRAQTQPNRSSSDQPYERHTPTPRL